VHILIAGTSARAASDSAARAGFEVTAIDAFADLDRHASVRALSMPRDFDVRATPRRMARAARGLAAEAVVYLSPFENHPQAVAELARNRRLLGNAPDVLREVRDPVFVYDALRRHGTPAARVRVDDLEHRKAGPFGPAGGDRGRGGRAGWMVKPLASGGGRGVRRWRPGSRLPARCYLQEFVDGVPGSVVFVAAGGRCSVLAVSRQLIGDSVFGAAGYRYCGSMMSLDPDDPWEGDRRLASGAHALADAASRLFRLVGVNGVDFVVRDGVPVAIEVNPRWSASMELVDRVCEAPLMAAHEEACRSGAPPHVHRPRDVGVTGKAIVFAKSRVTTGDTRRWIGSAGWGDVRDVPWPGTSFERGDPICTVLAAGRTFADCYAALASKAAAIYEGLRPQG
jgi:predicted ATP-grasp superfamily ATP-dependent carboligase